MITCIWKTMEADWMFEIQGHRYNVHAVLSAWAVQGHFGIIWWLLRNFEAQIFQHATPHMQKNF